MSITREELKQKAVECMEKLGISKFLIEWFKEKNSIRIYEYCWSFPACEEPKVLAKAKQLEDKCDCVVYAVVHTQGHVGEFYDFLYVPKRKKDWDELVTEEGKLIYAKTYRWEVDGDMCVDCGPSTIGTCSVYGGLARVI